MRGERKVEQPAVHFAALPRVVSAVNGTILFLAIAATPLIFFNIYQSLEIGWLNLYTFHSVLYASLLVFALGRPGERSSHYFLVLFFFVVGLAGYYDFCFSALSELSLLLTIVTASLLFGLRGAVLAACGILLGTFLITIVSPGPAHHGVESMSHHEALSSWLLGILALMLTSAVAIGLQVAIARSHEDQTQHLRQLELAIEQLDEGVVVFDSSDRIVFRNEAWLRLNSSILPECDIGVTFEEHLRAGVKAGIMVDGIGREDEWVAERLSVHRNPGEPREVNRQNGTTILVKEQVLTGGGCILTISDITDLKRAEASRLELLERLQAQRDSLSQLSMVAEGTDNPVVITDEKSRICWVNRAFESMSGYTLDEVRDLKPSQFLQGERTDEVAKSIMSDALARQQSFSVEVINYSKDNRPYMVKIDATPIVSDSGLRFVSVQRDLTSEKLQAQKVQHLDRLATLGESAAKFAHEVNQPLQVIGTAASNCLRFLQVKGDTSSASDLRIYLEKRLDRIVEQAQRAGTTITQMKRFSRLHEMDTHTLLLSEALTDAIGLVSEDLRLAEVELHADLEAANVEVAANPNQLSQVAINLLTNAKEAFVHSGRRDSNLIHLIVSRSDNDEVVFTVKDNAGGIDPAYVDRVFDPFYTSKPSGTGLGLTVCKEIIESMQGDLSVQLVPGGTAFSVTLPVAS